jgi:hypothetical protein
MDAFGDDESVSGPMVLRF